MAQLPRAPKKSELEDAPLQVQNYIKRLLELAKTGLETKNSVSPEFKIGKVSKDADGELDIPIIIALKRSGKPAKNFPINELEVDGESLIDESVYTDDKGEYVYRFHTVGVDSLEIKVGLQNFNTSDETELRYYQKVIEVTAPKEKIANKLKVIISSVGENNIVSKSNDSTGFFIILQVFCNDMPIKGTIHMVSDNYFQYTIKEISVAKRNHEVEVDGSLAIELNTSRDWQKITFFINGDKPQTFEFRKRT